LYFFTKNDLCCSVKESCENIQIFGYNKESFAIKIILQTKKKEEFDYQYGYVERRSNLGKLMKKKANDWILHSFINGIKQAFPILSWLPNVSRSDLIKDIIAGITVGVICVPQEKKNEHEIFLSNLSSSLSSFIVLFIDYKNIYTLVGKEISDLIFSKIREMLIK
uniref:Uncharacterized protein n=1 Tax=Onchocerca flexuosa TaxID=387005 RepID=A0A183HX36_9BILA